MVSLGGGEGWDLVYSRGIGCRWEQKWFICSNRWSHPCYEGADAGRGVHGIVGDLEVAYMCPKVCAVTSSLRREVSRPTRPS